MGTVWRAFDSAAGREVAVKVPSPDLARDPRFLARFERELRAARSVSHRNVVALLDAGEENGVPYLVFELVEGGTLEEKLRAEGRVGWSEAARTFARVASALAALHAAGLVHRD